MRNMLITFLILTSCGTEHTINGGAKITIDDIHIINPIIEFCERLHPEVLYPNELQREALITECMKLCSDSGECTVDIDLDQLTGVGQ
jgi:hypothetical protein